MTNQHDFVIVVCLVILLHRLRLDDVMREGQQPAARSQHPKVVIVTGLPCTGKTTLARRLSADLRLPLISKDSIKETLFDTLGWNDREWSRKLGAATMRLLYMWIEEELAAGRSFIVECNFKAEYDTTIFLELMERYPFTPFQIICHTEGPVLLERWKVRAVSGDRHPGHVDNLTLEEFTPLLLAGECPPLDIGGTLYLLDTSDFDRVNYSGLLDALERGIRE
jgi:predicted kinase